MSQIANYNQFDLEINEQNDNCIQSDSDHAEEQVFRKLSNTLSIEEKINLTVELHYNNYFLDRPVEE